MDIPAAVEFARTNHRAVMATFRRDGNPQLTPVAVTVDDSGDIMISSRQAAAKVKNIRRDPRVSLCLMNDGFYGAFAQIEGGATIVDLPEAMDGLVQYYRSISGEHPDWDDYREAMQREQRVLIKIGPTRAGPTYSG
jgi:PPOX class probable F420-dependent enzyme